MSRKAPSRVHFLLVVARKTSWRPCCMTRPIYCSRHRPGTPYPGAMSNSLTARMISRPRCPSTSRGTLAARADRNHHRAATVNRGARSLRRLNSSTRILEFP